MACSQGCESACRALEARYFSALRAFLGAFDARQEVVDELLQRVRFRLLVGPNPRIRTYRGKGSLQAWLRKVAQAVAVDALRTNIGRERQTQRVEQDAAYAELVHSAPPPPPDEHADRERYGQAVLHALSQAMHALSSDRRRLLYNYYVAGMSIDQLGSLYRIDRSTAARRVGRVVQELQRTLRGELVRRLGSLTAGELDGCWTVLCRKAGGGLTEQTCSDLLQLEGVSATNGQLRERDAGATGERPGAVCSVSP
ncbi:MAG TPA: sigma-70 family RNA polymerase sigma factor [Polyangiaceae bacterium]|nr:sigma-70 family RNA polymerase sigma factor [Polyangiaceae bacterium]